MEKYFSIFEHLFKNTEFTYFSWKILRFLIKKD